MDYYHISAEDLGKDAKIPLAFPGDSAAVFFQMAQDMVHTIREHNREQERTVFICPVGPVGQYPYFVKLVNEERLSLKNVWFCNMDEYLTDEDEWISEDDGLSFRGFMNRMVYTKLDPELAMPASQRLFPNPAHPEAIGDAIESLGGVDIAFGGIGITGHLAFNEPQPELSADEFAQLETRALSIRPETRATNSAADLCGALEDMPHRAVTIGMKEILSARQVRLGVFRTWHRGAVRHAAYGEISASFPATLLQKHPDALIYVNDVARERAY